MINEIWNTLLESRRLYDIKYRTTDDSYSKGVCDGINIALQEIINFNDNKNTEPTFDDLVDVTVQAVKDRVLAGLSVDFTGVRHLSFWIGSRKHEGQIFDQRDDYSEDIEHIKSLYTETFVIEHASDMKRIKRTAIIVLENDCEVCAESDCLHHGVNYIQTTYGGMNFNLNFLSLKGATVTQTKGD